MLHKLKKNQAQAQMTEYAVIIFVVIGMMTAMGTYVKRALQGRIHDARNYAVNSIKTTTNGIYNGIVYYEYEPYYINSTTEVQSRDSTTSRLFLGGANSKEFNSESIVMTNSETAPPKDAD